MKVFSSISDFSSDKESVITIGTFDGVHLGHRTILSQLNEIAKKVNGESTLITFFPHPRYVLYAEDQDMRLLNTLDEKKTLLEEIGIDNLIVHEFTKKFSRIKSSNFIRDILVEKLKVHTLIIGYNHHFGRNREGSFDELISLAELYDFKIEMISAQNYEDATVSSTKIRQLIEKGDIEKANNYLGYEYFVNGEVIIGNGVGNDLGFPTANILVKNKWKLLPIDGVYAVKVIVDGSLFNGMMNIGKKPTVNGKYKSLEVNIFNFSSDIYGKEIKIRFFKRVRDEKKFESLDSLKKQLVRDRNKVQQILG